MGSAPGGEDRAEDHGRDTRERVGGDNADTIRLQLTVRELLL